MKTLPGLTGSRQHRSPRPTRRSSLFVPGPEPARYEAPKATIDPDRSKTWLRRAMPILKSHRKIFIVSLVLSFVGLVLQVQIPKLLSDAIDNSIVPALPAPARACRCTSTCGGSSAWPWPGWCRATSRGLYLFQTAYRIEFDLRNIIYEHLTKMSFPFYDRVQSGQLISPGELRHPVGADVHDVRPDDPRAVQHRPGGLRLHAVDQRAPGLRGHDHDAVRLPDGREDAEVDVPGVVDHPGPSGRGGHHRRREHQRRAGW